jgi:hypothetical protein
MRSRGGVRLSDKGPKYATTPPSTYRQTGVQRLAEFALDTDNNLKGLLRVVMYGQEALRWRQLSLKNDEGEVKKQFKESMGEYIPDGVEADFDHFLGLNDLDVNLIAIVQIKGSVGTSTGKRTFMPGQFFESRGMLPFVSQDKRTTPVDVMYPKTETDQVTYNLPAGMNVESAPQASDASWPEHAVFKVKSESNANSVTVARTLVYNFTVLNPTDYTLLHDFYQKVATADQQQLVLAHATLAKGN